MDSSHLFSHPYEPEHVVNREDADEPVQAPTFSDRSDSASDKPSSS
jgi:hypothetical protein